MFFKKKKNEQITDMEQVPMDDVQESTVEAELPDDTVSADIVEEKKGRFKNLSKKKKLALGIGVVLLVAAIIGVILFGFPGAGSDNKVYVEKVSDIMGLGSGNGGQNRYAGVVESQEIWNIKQNADKTVKEIYVEEGDSVKIGDKLFAYDNDEAKLNLEQAQLELERMENEIKAGEAEIANLEKEKKSASGSDKLEYTIQIQSQRATNKKTEYEIKSQKAKIKSLKKATKNSVVKSEMDGVIKKINQAAGGGDDVAFDDMGVGSEDDSVFMSILATGDYRVKAMINEQNAWTIEEGKEVIIRSRIDDKTTWKGNITKIDMDNPESGSSNEYMDYGGDSGDETTTSSKYPFYVELESSEGLILGQHVYIEPDEGQDEKKKGLWLDAYYIVQEDNSSYVWAESMTKRLEKRKVTLGEYNEELDQYEIKDGLKKEDYIAYPMQNLKEGTKTTRNAAEATSVDDSGEGAEMGTDEIFTEPEDGFVDEYDGEFSEEFDDGFTLDEEMELEDMESFDEGDEGLEGDDWGDEPVNEDGSVGKTYRPETEVLS